jgi:hypothetical protein
MPRTSTDPIEQQECTEGLKARAFLSNLYQQIDSAQENAAMQAIYRYFHELCQQGDEALCGRILEDMDVTRLTPSLLVAVLTVTAPLKERLLDRRTSFFARARQAVAAVRGPEASQRILVGLE